MHDIMQFGMCVPWYYAAFVTHQTHHAYISTHHVTALLSSGLLVFEVNASRARLNEELGKLHHGRESTVAWQRWE